MNQNMVGSSSFFNVMNGDEQRRLLRQVSGVGELAVESLERKQRHLLCIQEEHQRSVAILECFLSQIEDGKGEIVRKNLENLWQNPKLPRHVLSSVETCLKISQDWLGKSRGARKVRRLKDLKRIFRAVAMPFYKRENRICKMIQSNEDALERAGALANGEGETMELASSFSSQFPERPLTHRMDIKIQKAVTEVKIRSLENQISILKSQLQQL